MPSAVLDGIRCVVVESQNEADAAIHDARERGLDLAAVSNAGLQGGRRRLTFVPNSAFVEKSAGSIWPKRRRNAGKENA